MPSKRGGPKSALSSAKPATPSTPSPSPKNCRRSTSTISSIPKTSAPTATPPPPGSTASPRPKSFTSTNERCAPKRTVVALPPCDTVETRTETVATKEHKRQAKALVEELEARVHVGPPICTTELASAHNFLRESEFSPASDYFGRLRQIQDRLTSRPAPAPVSRSPGKRDYGGDAA